MLGTERLPPRRSPSEREGVRKEASAGHRDGGEAGAVHRVSKPLHGGLQGERTTGSGAGPT